MTLIIMWFTISRIMVENRKETAVYRAMGAKRIDVTAIYTLLIAARISAISFILGIGVAYVVNEPIRSFVAAALGYFRAYFCSKYCCVYTAAYPECYASTDSRHA